jgi:hypothetical protein
VLALKSELAGLKDNLKILTSEATLVYLKSVRPAHLVYEKTNLPPSNHFKTFVFVLACLLLAALGSPA